MNHMRVFVPNYPPPPFHSEHSDIAPNTSATAATTQRSNLYKERLQNYIKSRKTQASPLISSERPVKSPKLCDVSTELSRCYSLIDKINEEIKVLSRSASSMTNHQWVNRISDLKMATNDLSTTCSNYQDTNLLSEVKFLAEKRLKKRHRIKKRKAETKAFKAYEAKNRELKHQKIDLWLEKNAEEIRENRRQIENKQRAEEILMEVKSRKNEAEKYLLVLDSLKTLYRIRNRDRPSGVSGEAEFNREIEDLKQIWLDASKRYAAEEKRLGKFLPSSNHWVEWRDVVFGEPTKEDILFALKKKDNGLNQLIKIRSIWDQCIVSDDNPFGSSVPFGWVISNQNPSDEWKTYVKND